MNKRNNRRGFTMAEMLIVIAIIGVLSAVAFVAFAQHQRSLARLERDSIAQEVFMAAQNHLTLAQSQGYLGITDFGEKEKPDDPDDDIYYIIKDGEKGQGMLELMLPFGSVDGNVLGGGSYIIRYQKDIARVLDVFYCTTDAPQYNHTLSTYDYLTGEKGKGLVADWSGDANTASRRNFTGNSVLGWYGGDPADTIKAEAELVAPTVRLINAETLRVEITDPNLDSDPTLHNLKLIVTGKTSGVKKVFLLKSTEAAKDLATTPTAFPYAGRYSKDTTTGTITFVLDDITGSDRHFGKLKEDPSAATESPFIPGEDITVKVVVDSNVAYVIPAESGELTDNSLYEKNVLDGTIRTASINNIRHLENLEEDISNVADSFKPNVAKQTTDLVWASADSGIRNTAFTYLINEGAPGAVSIHPYDSTKNPTAAGCYWPVTPDVVTPGNALTYDGQHHSVTGIKVDTAAGDAGMFGTLDTGCSISNLKLIDFDIKTTSGNAGALVGTLTQASTPSVANVSNVIAYNSTNSTTIKVSASGNAGGLIGAMAGGKGKIEKSAAALIVESTGGDAGGLIGTIGGGAIEACYSGGHTIDDASGAVIYSNSNYNVTSNAENGNAGGLIGSFTAKTTLNYCYSTCSVEGHFAGGFVGTGANTESSIINCYATGLVKGTGVETTNAVPTDGAFAYSLTNGMTIGNCRYLESINERPDTEKGFDYLTPLGNKGSNSGITAIDSTVQTYNDFIGASTGWDPARPYDSKLLQYYRVYDSESAAYLTRYPLKTVEQLMKLANPDASLKTGADDPASYFVTTHYGDWPAPEIFVMNTPNP